MKSTVFTKFLISVVDNIQRVKATKKVRGYKLAIGSDFVDNLETSVKAPEKIKEQKQD